jgi:predicted outer membrane repeat protein
MMKKNILILTGILISHCLCPALATIYNVNPGESIQTAIDSASYFDTVQVAAGTYVENITLKNGIALVGAGAATTTIDPNGGTVVLANVCDPNTRLSGFTITGGAGSSYGGGIYIYYSDIVITDCAFVGNSANYGGGMYIELGSPTLINCTFSGNMAHDGGGMYSSGTRPTVTNCTFSSNSAVLFGGGIYIYYSDIVITNCAFVGNSANYGGAMRNHFSDPAITNCVFSGNSAILGAGVSNNNSCCPTFTNCTFSKNSASDYGGTMRNYKSTPTITNCIMFHNTADISGDEISNSDSSPVISHSDIAGCGSSAAWNASFGTNEGGNKDADPLFVRQPYDGGDGWGDDPCTPADESANDDYGDLHLTDGSPCIDAGDNSALIANPLDLDGFARVSNNTVDMGAYEVVCLCSLTGDFDCSCGVDFADFAMFLMGWMTEPADGGWNPACDISEPADDLVDITDVRVLGENWLNFYLP